MMLMLFVVQGSTIGQTVRKQIMEYYIYYKGSFVTVFGVRYEHAYATWDEAEKARQKAAVDTRGGAEDFLANTYVKEVPTGRYVDLPSQLAAPSPQPAPTTPPPANPAPPPPSNNFQNEKDALLRDLKAGGTLESSTDGGGRISVVSPAKRALPDKDGIAEARAKLEKMDAPEMEGVKTGIAQRLTGPDPRCNSLVRSLKIKAPPLPDKMFSELLPGDVLLIAPEDSLTFGAWTGHYIRLFDKLSSWEWESRASHSCIYLKEVNGVRFFLDNLPGEGPRIKTDDEIIEEYGARAIDVARPKGTTVATPVRKMDAEKLWAAARELGIKQIAADQEKAGNLIDTTNYGLYGRDNMVCSEASRFVLLKAGLDIPDTNSLFKKLLGIYFGPANFYSQEQYFLITPLGTLPNRTDK